MLDVDIWNMALGHLGVSVTVQSLTPPDQNAQGQAGAFWYPKCRDWLIQNAPWKFSYTYINLVQEPIPSQTGPQVGQAAPGWKYSYQYPQDCLQPIAVTTMAGSRVGPQYWVGYWWPSIGINWMIPKIPYQVEESKANPGQLCITSDILATSGNPLYLFYIQKVTNTALFDPLFTGALAYLCAWWGGGTLRSDANKISEAQQNFWRLRNEALAQHLNAAQQDQERDSPSVVVR